MRIEKGIMEYRLAYRFPWEFIFFSWKLRTAIKIWCLHSWQDDMRDLWFDRGWRFLGVEFMKRKYCGGSR